MLDSYASRNWSPALLPNSSTRSLSSRMRSAADSACCCGVSSWVAMMLYVRVAAVGRMSRSRPARCRRFDLTSTQVRVRLGGRVVKLSDWISRIGRSPRAARCREVDGDMHGRPGRPDPELADPAEQVQGLRVLGEHVGLKAPYSSRV